MGKLIYLLNVSLDGFVETPDRSLDWANVDEELHTWFTEIQKSHPELVDAYLVQRSGTQDGRVPVRATAVRSHGGVLADGSIRSVRHRADARLRPDLEHEAQDCLLNDAPGRGVE